MTNSQVSEQSWFLRHGVKIVGVLCAVVIALSGIAAFLIWDDSAQNSKLKGVDVVGPCRLYGKDNPECIRQSFLIVR